MYDSTNNSPLFLLGSLLPFALFFLRIKKVSSFPLGQNFLNQHHEHILSELSCVFKNAFHRIFIFVVKSKRGVAGHFEASDLLKHEDDVPEKRTHIVSRQTFWLRPTVRFMYFLLKLIVFFNFIFFLKEATCARNPRMYPGHSWRVYPQYQCIPKAGACSTIAALISFILSKTSRMISRMISLLKISTH